MISHLQALHCRVIKITAKRRYLEALSDTLESASRLLFPSSDDIPTPDIDSVLQNLPGYIGRFRIEGELIAAGLESILRELELLKPEHEYWDQQR